MNICLYDLITVVAGREEGNVSCAHLVLAAAIPMSVYLSFSSGVSVPRLLYTFYLYLYVCMCLPSSYKCQTIQPKKTCKFSNLLVEFMLLVFAFWLFIYFTPWWIVLLYTSFIHQQNTIPI